MCAAVARWGPRACRTCPSRQRSSRGEGVALNAEQAYVAEILTGLLTSTPECTAIWAPDGRVLREGQTIVDPELGTRCAGSASEGSPPF